MKRLLYLVLLLFTYSITYSIDIPDDFVPIENNSLILFSYEFDEPPLIMERLSDDRIIIAVKDDEVLELFLFDNKKNEINEVGEIELTDMEFLYKSEIVNDNLELVMTGNVGFSLFSKGDTYARRIVYDIKNEKIESNTLLYLFQNSKLDYDEIEDELNLTRFDVSIPIIDGDKYFEESKIAQNELPIAMDISPNAIDFNNPMAVGITFYPDKLYDDVMLIAGLSKDDVAIKPIRFRGIEEVENMVIHYAHYKSESITFLAEWYNPETEKNYLSLNKVTNDGKLAETIKEIPLDEDYRFQKFVPIESNSDNMLMLLGYAEDYDNKFHSDEELSHFALINLNLNTLDFDLKIKTFEESNRNNPDLAEVELVINNINNVIKKDDCYVVLAENSFFSREVETRGEKVDTYNRSSGKFESKSTGRNIAYKLYNDYFRNINLFKLDKDLNLVWSTEIEDRDLERSRNLFLAPKNLFSNILPSHYYLNPTITNDDITFTYSTTEPEDEIRKVKISLTDGKILEEHSLFENDGYASFIPGNQISLGEGVYGTILDQDDYYFVKYKLNK